MDKPALCKSNFGSLQPVPLPLAVHKDAQSCHIQETDHKQQKIHHIKDNVESEYRQGSRSDNGCQIDADVFSLPIFKENFQKVIGAQQHRQTRQQGKQAQNYQAKASRHRRSRQEISPEPFNGPAGQDDQPLVHAVGGNIGGDHNGHHNGDNGRQQGDGRRLPGLGVRLLGGHSQGTQARLRGLQNPLHAQDKAHRHPQHGIDRIPKSLHHALQEHRNMAAGFDDEDQEEHAVGPHRKGDHVGHGPHKHFMLPCQHDHRHHADQRQDNAEKPLDLAQGDVEILSGDDGDHRIDAGKLEAAEAEDVQGTEADRVDKSQLGAQEGGNILLGGHLHDLGAKGLRIGHGDHDERADKSPDSQGLDVELTLAAELGKGTQHADDGAGAYHSAQRDNRGAHYIGKGKLTGTGGLGLDFAEGLPDEPKAHYQYAGQKNRPDSFRYAADYFFNDF